MAFEIYRITHRASGKSYIGCTKRGTLFRWRSHIYASSDSRRSYFLHRAIAKYGADAFNVLTVAVANSMEEMRELESKWIAECNTISPNGYNLTSGGDGMRDPSPETREKLRQNSAGNKYFLGRTHSAETKTRMSASAVRSPEHRAAISRAQKGRFVSAETCAKISASKTGKTHVGVKHSDEAKKKMSEQRRGRKLTAEQCRNMSIARMGFVHSAESIAKLSASRTGLRLSLETKLKRSENMRKRALEKSISNT